MHCRINNYCSTYFLLKHNWKKKTWKVFLDVRVWMPKPVHRSLKRYGYVTEHLPFLAPPSLNSLNILMIEHGLHETWQKEFLTGVLRIKVNKSRYKQCVVIPHFSIGQYLLRKILKKDTYWQSQLRKAFW